MTVMSDLDELGSGQAAKRPNTVIVHFGSPPGTQYSRPESPLIITSRMPDDRDDD